MTQCIHEAFFSPLKRDTALFKQGFFSYVINTFFLTMLNL